MDISLLRSELDDIKQGLERTIRTATFRDKPRSDGLKAKESFIRSHELIMPIHEVVKTSLRDELKERNLSFQIHPPVGETSPELKFFGYLKSKKQDISVLFDGDSPVPEKINEGPLEGVKDPVGKDVSRRSIVIGVRSQMSSVGKNFDTLMERLFAETLNLRLRLTSLTMGEVYLLPVVPYKSEPMKENKVRWKDETIKIETFLRTFSAFSGRSPNDYEDKEEYMYERSALLLTDFRHSPPKVYKTTKELKQDNLVSDSFEIQYENLSPKDFASDIIDKHLKRHDQLG
ncbi:hypothetical protein GGP91_001589 [Salinibacter ruber]|uniref:hypothetical protein n=1 Tax=Salinibacter ruber TaxID=146919 RepID=UPI002169C611|nr:hypothetical protein [Salinibacter ruber]MCS3829512.1 hypothetical protein [Salinibacter ruber]MCS4170802.1 hypothetical protein [Salinibacter ruber]